MSKLTRICFISIWLWTLLPHMLTENVPQQKELPREPHNCNTTNVDYKTQTCRCNVNNERILITRTYIPNKQGVAGSEGDRSAVARNIEIDCFFSNLRLIALKEILNGCEFEKYSGLSKINFRRCPVLNESFIHFLIAFDVIPAELNITASSPNDGYGLQPYHFKQLILLRALYITNTGFSQLTSSTFDDMPHIRSMELSNNSITSLPNELFKPTSELVNLKIMYNNLSSLDSGFRFPPNLQWLIITENNLRNISKNIFTNLTKLKGLYLDNNNITHLDDNIFDHLQQLITLRLDGNNFTRLPDNLFSYNCYLEAIFINKTCSKQLSMLPSAMFANLTHLQNVVLNDNYFTTLPNDLFENCPGLLVIELNNNTLRRLPDSIFQDAVHLEELYLSNNELETLNYTIFNHLKKLDQIRLTNAFSRETSTLPPALFANLTSLSKVYLNENHFTHIPDNLFLNCSNLKVVSLANNFLRELPINLFKDTILLEELDLRDNQLESLNAEFKPLEKLQRLYLSRNRLVSISSRTFQTLMSLTELNLSYNHLTDFESNTFYYLENIIDIDLSHNQLTLNKTKKQEEEYEYANSPFCNCQKLQTLVLRNNSLDRMFLECNFGERFIKLKLLDLSFNKFSVLKPTRFLYETPELDSITVNLSNNRISTIRLEFSENTMENNDVILYRQSCNGKPKIGNPRTTFDLANNHITCDCKALQLVNYIQEQKYCVTNIRFQGIRCYGPERLRNKYLGEINLLDLRCPLNSMYPEQNENCPESCNCEYRSVDHCVIVNCTGASLRSFPLKLLNLYEFALELEFSRNNFTSLDGLSNLTSIANVTKLVLSFNGLNTIDDLDIWNGLKVLELDNNRISYLSNNTIQKLYGSKTLTNLTLHNNPWQCDCQYQYFADFLQDQLKNKKSQISNYDDITCQDNGQSILLRRNFCDESTSELYLYVLVPICVLLVIGFTSSITYYNYKTEIKVWLFAHKICSCLINQHQIDKDKLYDAFISFSGMDSEFVEEHLRPQLESEYKICVHHRDFVVGDYIGHQIARAVENSRKIIIVLTPNFLQSTWTQQEFRLAHIKAIRERCDRVIIILLEDIPTKNLDPTLKAYITTRTYLKWGDPLFWKRLKIALPQRQCNPEP